MFFTWHSILIKIFYWIILDYLSVEFDDVPINSTHQDRGSYGAVLFGTASGVGWVGAGAFPTGWILLVVITIMFIFAMPFIRRNGYFQVSFFFIKFSFNYSKRKNEFN